MIKREFRHDFGSTVIVTMLKKEMTEREKQLNNLPITLQKISNVMIGILLLTLVILIVNVINNNNNAGTLTLIAFLLLVVNIILFFAYYLAGKTINLESNYTEINKITNDDVGKNIVNRLFQLHQYALTGFNTNNINKDVNEIMEILDAGFGYGHLDDYSVDKKLIVKEIDNIISLWEANLHGSNTIRNEINKLTDYDNEENDTLIHEEQLINKLQEMKKRVSLHYDFITEDRRSKNSEFFEK